MSVRIYQLSKEIGMDNSELIQLLRERGHEAKSASSTVDNISADALREEFGSRGSAEEAPSDSDKAEATEPQKEEDGLPSGAIVRSREEIEREREEREREEAERKKRQSAVIQPPQPRPAPSTPGMAAPAVPSIGKAPPRVSIPRVGVSAPPSRAAAPSRAPATPPPVPQPQPKQPEPQPKAPNPAADTATGTPAPKVSQPGPVPVKLPPRAAPTRPEAPKPESQTGSPAPAPAPRLSPPKVSAPPRVSQPPAPPRIPRTPERESAPAEETASRPAPSSRIKVQVKPPIVVRDFAVQIGKKPFQLISELMEMGIFASMNQVIEEDVAVRLAEKHGFELEVRHRGEPQQQQKQEEAPPVDEAELMEPRPPVVCILGHVDHGKTTLLDSIRKTNVVAGEAGGITQHIGAYQVEHKGKKITFIDTPGHAAFSNMRARGANITDIAVLVVAADDGFMPQTDEALGHARKAGVPVVVAINKMDAPGANIDRVKRQMQERNLAPEDWGGETLSATVSALKGEGIEDLLEAILLQADVTEGIEANPSCPAEGVVIEAQKEIGVGATATVIIEKGTLQRGDALVCGPNYCRVRTLIDDQGKQIKSATPGMPVKIAGWSGAPDAGDTFVTVKNEREAKRAAEEYEHQMKLRQARSDEPTGRASLDDLFAAIEQTRQKVFPVIVKSDVFGTAEALAVSLEQIKSDKIKLDVVDMGVGAVSKSDITMASASEAAIVAFNVGLESGAGALAKHHSIRIFSHNIIYELIDQIKDAMADELPPELRENKMGAAEVRQVFPVARGEVAGCMVTEGRVARGAVARLIRKDKVMHESRIGTLRRFKEDVGEVRAGYECGIQIDGFSGYQEGDIIECIEILKIKASL